MITEAILSFIGAGTPPIIPSWGNIMAEGRQLWQVKPHIVFFPALFLSLTVLAVNLLEDGLRRQPRSAHGQAGVTAMPLLEVENLQDAFPHARRRGEPCGRWAVLHGGKGQRRLPIVGESGCGKSVTSLSILRLVPQPPGKIAGRILFEWARFCCPCPNAPRDIRRATRSA